jgi:hypothetical protein
MPSLSNYKTPFFMKKRNVLLSAVALSTLVLGSCQRTPYAAFQHSSTQPIERVQTVQPASQVVAVAPVVAAPTLTEAMAPAAPTAVAATASLKKAPAAPKFVQKKAEALMAKTQFVKSDAGVASLQVREGQKLNGMEKLVVKKVNKQLKKAEAKGKGGAFSDLNKFLRIGIILLGISIVLSILGAVVVWNYGLWVIVYLTWLAGIILGFYGLGLQLDWW